MQKNKMVFEGYTTKDISPCWTVYNTFNLAAVLQKNWAEAIARYEDGFLGKNIIKLRITIEKIEDDT